MQSHFVDKAVEHDPREAKLPSWVRGKLDTMRRATLEARQELAALKAGSQPSAFWLEDWESSGRFYLPPNGRLKFGGGPMPLELSHGRNGTEKEWLMISAGSDGLIAAPHASNVLLVRNAQ